MKITWTRSLMRALRAGAAAVGMVAGVQSAETLRSGEHWFVTDFEDSNAWSGWSAGRRFDSGYQSRQALRISTDETPDHPTVSRRLPVENVRGCTIRATARVRAASVSVRPNAWNGVKFMLMVESPDGRSWPQAPLETGSYPWQRAAFTTRIPDNATNAVLVLGLEQVTGTAWFDDIRLTVTRERAQPKAVPVAGPLHKGHALPRLRGAMVGPRVTGEDLRVLGQDWNANLIRWQLIRHGRPGQPSTLEDYDAWIEGELQRLDALLPACERYGLRVALDLHSPPGGKETVSGYIGSDDRLFTDRKAQDKFVEVWQRMAQRYKHSKVIWGYDIANEPVEEYVEDGCDDWQALAERTARAIRAIDPERAIIVEAPPWGSPESLAGFIPLPVSNIVYSCHMYVPHEFTHQNVHNKGVPPLEYPGMIKGRMWDKAALEKALLPAINFQRTYNVHIYIGEFSAIRWAPGDSARRYLSDVIEIFESHGWDWSYHAFREWDGWSVEHGSNPSDRSRSQKPTDRQQLLQGWFRQNQKPH